MINTVFFNVQYQCAVSVQWGDNGNDSYFELGVGTRKTLVVFVDIPL